MLYGICGSSGSGKSTLGRMVAESLDMTFQPTSITECAKRHGFDAVGSLSLEQRLELQNHLLADHVEMIGKAKRPLIVDRTPIDFIAYLLAEFHMHSHEGMQPSLLLEVRNYVDLCLKETRAHYDMVFMLAPLPVYEVSVTRPAPNPAYQAHTDLIMRGALSCYSGPVAIINVPDQQIRFNFVHDTIVERLNELEKKRKTSRSVH